MLLKELHHTYSVTLHNTNTYVSYVLTSLENIIANKGSSNQTFNKFTKNAG